MHVCESKKKKSYVHLMWQVVRLPSPGFNLRVPPVFEVWISESVESGPAMGSEGQASQERDPRKQAPVLLNGPIMAWITRNVIMETCY